MAHAATAPAVIRPGGQVKLTLHRRPNKTQYYKVRVYSKVKPNSAFEGIEEWEPEDQAQRIGVLAGALAEELCVRFQDTIDPSDCAHAGVRAYRRLRAQIEKATNRDVERAVQPGTELPRDADAHLAGNRQRSEARPAVRRRKD